MAEEQEPSSRGTDASPAGRALVTHDSAWRNRVVDRSLAKVKERSLQRAHSFIEATIVLMESRGDVSFTLQELCDAAGQSLGTFYHHFSGKNDLVLAVYEELFVAHVERIAKEVDALSRPLDRLATAITAAVAPAVDIDERRRALDRALAHFRLEFAGEQANDVSTVQRPYVELVSSLVGEAITAGELPTQNVEHATYLICALKSNYLHSMLLGNEIGVEAPTVAELAQFCLRGIGGDVTGGSLQSGLR